MYKRLNIEQIRMAFTIGSSVRSHKNVFSEVLASFNY